MCLLLVTCQILNWVISLGASAPILCPKVDGRCGSGIAKVFGRSETIFSFSSDNCFFFCLLLHFDRGCVLIYTTFIRKSAGEKYLMPSLDAEKFNLGEQFFRFFFSSILWIIHIFFFKKKLQIILKNPLKLIF